MEKCIDVHYPDCLDISELKLVPIWDQGFVPAFLNPIFWLNGAFSVSYWKSCLDSIESRDGFSIEIHILPFKKIDV